MRGHEPLIAMRLRGLVPPMVSINVGPQSDWLAEHWHETEGLMPHLLVEPGDAIATLDLRCVCTLLVDVSGHVEHAERIRRVFEACVKAEACRVLGAVHESKGGTLRAVEYLDTAGVLTWP